jgi:hypothetical protein
MRDEPVSWLMIEPGWTVCTADGDEVGHVAEVAGDSGMDVFHGIAVSTRMLGKPRYVAAEQIGTIVEGRVHLLITRDEFRRQEPFEEPAVTARIEAGASAFGAEPVAPPGPAEPESVPLGKQLLAWLRSLGKR